MKKILFIISLLVFPALWAWVGVGYAQAPQGINYQGVARKSSGSAISKLPIGLQFQIHAGSSFGTVVYSEKHSLQTDTFGLYTVVIGSASGTGIGTFSAINWSAGVFFIEVDIDPNGGTLYTPVSTNQLMSVPYALYSGSSSTGVTSVTTNTPMVTGGTLTNPVISIPPANGSTNGYLTNTDWNIFNSKGNGTVTSITTGTGLLPAGTFTNALTISADYTTAIWNANKLQSFPISVTTPTTGQVLQYNGTQWTPFTPVASGGAWLLSGNTIPSATNYIGTNNNFPLNFKVNNQKAGVVDPAGSTFFGYQAGTVNTGTANVGIGYQALFNTTSGDANTATGYSALLSNTTGSLNTATGAAALFSNTTGYQNTAGGKYALFANTTGYYNTATGTYALSGNTTGINNTANGSNALQANTTGYLNTANGADALYFNTTASQNTAFGSQALYTQSFNNGGVAWNSDNVAIGYQALFTNNPTATTNGINNTAVGNFALYANTTGFGNTASGNGALVSNTTGLNNTATGLYALNSNTIGNKNTALGLGAGYSNSTGTGNVFLGYNAGYNELGSGKLYIANSPVNPPLIYGDFAAGNIGLGTTTPGALLDIGPSPIALSLRVTNTNANSGTAGYFNNTSATNVAPALQVNAVGTGDALSVSTSGTGMGIFSTNTGSSGGAGGFKISTVANPSNALQVNTMGTGFSGAFGGGKGLQVDKVEITTGAVPYAVLVSSNSMGDAVWSGPVNFSGSGSVTSVPPNTITPITFQTIDYTLPAAAFNGTVFTAPVTGLYHFDGGVALNTTSITGGSYDYQLQIMVGNTAYRVAYSKITFNQSPNQNNISLDIRLIAGQTVQLAVLQNYANLSVYTAINYTYFTGHLIH